MWKEKIAYSYGYYICLKCSNKFWGITKAKSCDHKKQKQVKDYQPEQFNEYTEGYGDDD